MSGTVPEPAPIGDQYDPIRLQPSPWGFYARARREEPVFYAPATGAYMVTRYEDVRRVLGDVDVFSMAGVLRVMEVLSEDARTELQKAFPPFPPDEEPGDAARLKAREPISRAFSPERVRTMDAELTAAISALLDDLDARGPGDLMTTVGRPLPIHGKAIALGLRSEDLPALVDGAYALSVLSSGGSTLDGHTQLELARAVVPYQAMLSDYVNERIATRGTDLISQIVTAVEEAASTRNPSAVTRTTVETLIALIGAGQSTTTSSFGLAVHRLLSDGEGWRKLAADPRLAPVAVEELLRLDSPIQALKRRTTCPVTLGGIDLDSGTDVMAVFASANRDETEFEDGDTLRIGRSPNRHLAFGYGPRFCVGIHLARRLLSGALGGLAQRHPDLRPAGEPAMTLWPGIHRLVRTLEITW
ncbi:cytochrome P450 [Nocardia sp. NPDC051570]|uniref:cytochrome P450 n=1 Tax=Nocardia sp. NPDC051570 TaxID=3364324 RepID=UPI0037B60456